MYALYVNAHLGVNAQCFHIHWLIPCCDCHCFHFAFHPGSETGDYDRESRKTDLKGYPPSGELNYG